jgi:hypothetical protein
LAKSARRSDFAGLAITSLVIYRGLLPSGPQIGQNVKRLFLCLFLILLIIPLFITPSRISAQGGWSSTFGQGSTAGPFVGYCGYYSDCASLDYDATFSDGWIPAAEPAVGITSDMAPYVLENVDVITVVINVTVGAPTGFIYLYGAGGYCFHTTLSYGDNTVSCTGLAGSSPTRVDVGVATNDVDHPCGCTIKTVTFSGDTGTDPFIPVLDTPEPSAFDFSDCPLMGDAATFRSLNNNFSGWTGDSTLEHPEGQDYGLLFPSGLAQINMTLSKFRMYKLTVKYHLTATAEADTRFDVKIGQSPSYVVNVANNTSNQTFEVPAASYIPSSTGASTNRYTINLVKSAIAGISDWSINPNLVLDYFCLRDATPSASGGSGGGSGGTGTGGTADIFGHYVAAQCQTCTFTLTADLIEDIAGAIRWIFCGLSYLVQCVVIPTFYMLLNAIGRILLLVLQMIGWARQWGEDTLLSGVTWGTSTLLRLTGVGGGYMNNTIAAVQSGLTTAFPNLQAFPDWLQFVFTNAGQVGQGIFGFVGSVFQLIASVISFVVTTVVSLISAGASILQLLIGIFTTAFNATAAVPPGIPVCDTTASTIPETCLQVFMIDNTILADASPVWAVWGLFQGAAGLGLITWAIIYIRNTFVGQDAEA